MFQLSCVIDMKLKLSVSKRQINGASGYREEIVFAVVDLGKADEYPANFVCLLPKNIEKCKPSSKFFGIFGAESSKIAIELLTDAFSSESDVAVRSEIKLRLKALQPMPKIKAKCINCGCDFEAKKFGRFLQKTCLTCRNKNQLSC